MSKPLVSVLVPVYNGEPYLAECLDSILAQDFTDFELLISDNRSTDGTVAVIERYARQDPRIRWWQNPQNLGMGGNFNAGLAAAQGEFIKFVLHDDKLNRPAALGRMVAALQSDPTVSLVATATQMIDAQSRPLEVRDRFKRTEVRAGELVIQECLNKSANFIGEPSIVLFRRSLAARGFDLSLKQLLDVEFWFHLLEPGRFAYLAEPLCAFRQHAAQATQINEPSGVGRSEWFLLWSRYLARPWFRATLTRKTIFNKMDRLRDNPDPGATALRVELGRRLGPYGYAYCWLRYRLGRSSKRRQHRDATA